MIIIFIFSVWFAVVVVFNFSWKFFLCERKTQKKGGKMNAAESCPRVIDGLVCGGFIISDPFAGRVCEQCGNVIEDLCTLRSEAESHHVETGTRIGNFVAATDNGYHYTPGSAGYKDAVLSRQHFARVCV